MVRKVVKRYWYMCEFCIKNVPLSDGVREEEHFVCVFLFILLRELVFLSDKVFLDKRDLASCGKRDGHSCTS